jgi:hypothetical protein
MKTTSRTLSIPTAHFTASGIRMPYEGLKSATTAPDEEYAFPETRIVTRDILYGVWWRIGCFLPGVALGLETFWEQAQALRQTLLMYSELSGLIDGVCLPLVIPVLSEPDYGCRLAQILPAVKASYQNWFPQRRFIDCLNYDRSENLTIIRQSNMSHLNGTLTTTPVVGLYFPDALRGWSIRACREQMQTFPASLGMILPDAIIHGLGIIGYPYLLAHGLSTPGLDCAGNSWHQAQYSLCYKAYDTCLEFCPATNLTHALGSYSGGLLFVG